MAIDLSGKSFNVIQWPLMAGDNFDLEFNIANTGLDDAGTFKVGFYLSTDTTITTEDTFLGLYQINSLDGNSETGILTTNLGLPALDDPWWINGNGEFYIGAVIDSQSEVTEGNEANNSSTGSLVDYEKTRIFSLVTSSFNIIQKSLKPKETIDIQFSIDNLSEIKAEAFNADVYLSLNDWISINDFHLGSYLIDGLDGKSDTGILTASFELPDELNEFWQIKGSGTYYIGLFVNNSNEANQMVNFKNPNSNAFSDYDAIKVSNPALVDLTGEYFNVTSEPVAAGTSFDIDFSVVNKEAGTADTFTIDFYLSENEWISDNDLKLGSYTVNGLAGYSSTGNLTKNFTLPSELDKFWKAKGNGTYYLGMKVNDQKPIDETFFSNNSNQGEFTDSDGVEVSLPTLVNLVPQTINVVQEPYSSGQSVDIEFSVYNEQVANAGSFDVDFYISSNDYISTFDTYLGSYRVSELNGRDSTGKLTTTFALPTIDSQQDYYIGMIVDGKNEVTETREFNSRPEFGEFVFYDGPDSVEEASFSIKPDLVGQSFDINPEKVIAGDTVNLDFSIFNLREPDAGSFTVDFYLSSNSRISTGDKLLGSYIIDSLDGFNSTGKFSKSFVLPSTSDEFWLEKGDGTYYIGAVVDSKNEIDETSELNNANKGELIDFDGLEITNPTLIDLVGQSFNVFQESLPPGGKIDIDFSVLNQKLGTAGSFSVDFYVSTNEYFSTGDFKLGSYSIDGLAGKSSTGKLKKSFDLPAVGDAFWSGGDGTYYVGMMIDSNDDIKETEEKNNSGQKELIDYDSIDVTTNEPNPVPDLTPFQFDVVQDTLTGGSSVDVKYEVYNDGAGAAKQFAVGFYLFTEDYLTDRDQLSLDDAPLVYPLNGDRNSLLIDLEGRTSTGEMTTSIELPDASEWDVFSANRDGYYYLGMSVDEWDDVREGNEDNNSLQGEMIDYEKVYIDFI
jgi:hypothetical protein